MEVNPYAPPQAKVADPPPNSHGLKRRSVLVMVVFTIISFGLYYPIWWFRRRQGLNRLNSTCVAGAVEWSIFWVSCTLIGIVR